MQKHLVFVCAVVRPWDLPANAASGPDKASEAVFSASIDLGYLGNQIGTALLMK